MVLWMVNTGTSIGDLCNFCSWSPSTKTHLAPEYRALSPLEHERVCSCTAKCTRWRRPLSRGRGRLHSAEPAPPRCNRCAPSTSTKRVVGPKPSSCTSPSIPWYGHERCGGVSLRASFVCVCLFVCRVDSSSAYLLRYLTTGVRACVRAYVYVFVFMCRVDYTFL